MKKIITIILATFLLILPISACKTNDGKLKKVRLNEVTHSVFYVPLYLAIELDYFTEEGIKLELTNGGGADKTMTAVLTGAADIGFCGPEAAIYVYNEGKKNYPIIFGQLTKRDGSFLVSRKAEPDFKWENLTGKEIIAGRRGGVPAMTLEYVLNNHNLINGENITLNYDISFPNMGPSFESGVGDYSTLFEPTASTMESAGKCFIVASVGAESGEVPYTAFMANKNYFEKNPTTIKAFLKAIYKAIKFMEDTSSDIIATKILPQFNGSTKEEVKASIESYKKIDAWMKNMSMTEDSFNRLQDIMENAGELSKRAVYKDLVNNTYADKVYKQVF